MEQFDAALERPRDRGVTEDADPPTDLADFRQKKA
jgi:hypothetical protein